MDLLPPANVLPAEAVALLRHAASTRITKNNPEARVNAIELATAQVKRDHPHFFRQEPTRETQA